MGELVNLRRARKRKERDARDAAAESNRLLHGIPKRQREAAKAENALITRAVDARRLDRDKEN